MDKKEEECNKKDTEKEECCNKEDTEKEECCNKKDTEIEECCNKLELPDKNIIRIISNYIQPFINPLKGLYYGSLHLLIMILCGIILLFDNNIYHLCVLLNIIVLDSACCVFIHDCPLTLLEQKYLNHSLVNTQMFILRNLNILYKCDHVYDMTIEFLTNMGSLVVGKIIILITLQIFDIKFRYCSSLM